MRLSTFLLVLSLPLFSTALAPEPDEPPDIALIHNDFPVDADDADGPCAALTEAGEVMSALGPRRDAHLEKKLGGLAYSGSGSGSGAMGGSGGWNHQGPLATASRLLPRLLDFLTPSSIFSHLPVRVPFFSRTSTPRISKRRRERVGRLKELVDEAEGKGCQAVWAFKGRLGMFPPKGMEQDLPAAFEAYTRSVQNSSDPEGQFMLGFFHATGLGGMEQNQGKALLYYTFSALQGYRPAEMALGYRYWAGIGVKEDCLTALDFYESAAEEAYITFLSGPPGGLALPLTHTRLSDLSGGIFGPHASSASSGALAHRAVVRAATASARGETEREILEYYAYHSSRDSHFYTVRLGRLYYLGSVYPMMGGIASGAEGVGEIPQNFKRAKEHFMRVARVMWPTDIEADGTVSRARTWPGGNVDPPLRDAATVAASFLGRMALRGEGGKADYIRARMWYERAAELGDKEAHNGLGSMHRDGFGVPVDKQKAYHYFQAAAGQDLAEAQVNLGKLHLERGEVQQAMQFFEAALRNGSPFEAFHLAAGVHARTARLPAEQGGRSGMCGVGVAWYKLVAEKGNWADDYMSSADRAYARGELDNAMLGWSIAAEMGYEAAQNNVAFLLERGEAAGWYLRNTDLAGSRKVVDSRLESEGKAVDGATDDAALVQWVRSAAQDNVDAMVRVGDYLYRGVGTHPAGRYERAAGYYQTAADTQSSSMAYWNLGYMYENALGVPQDWHLAKRYYDMALEIGSEAYLPVTLSLIKLYVRSWYTDFLTHGATPGLPLSDPSLTPSRPSLWSRIQSLFHSPAYPDDIDDAALDHLDGLPSEPREQAYEDHSGAGSGWEPGEMDDVPLVWEDLAILGVLVMMLGLWVLRRRYIEEERRRVAGEAAVVGEIRVGPVAAQ